MRIEPKVVTPVSGYKTREQAPAATSSPDDSSRSSVVKLSTAGVAVTGAGAAAGADGAKPAISARVAQIRSALAAGTYPIDLDKLASRIVDDDVARGGGGSS